MKGKKKVMLIVFFSIFILLSQSLVFAKQYRPSVYSISTFNSKLTNGDFLVKYNAEDIDQVILYYGDDPWNMETMVQTDCECGRNKECLFHPDLIDFENKEIKYFFEIIDKNGNIGQSKSKKVKVDTTNPKIINSDSIVEVKKSFTYFTIEIDDENLDRVEYVDNFDSDRSIVLCRNCRNNCVCSAKKRFRRGDYDLTITVFDKAGNSVSQDVSFTIP